MWIDDRLAKEKKKMKRERIFNTVIIFALLAEFTFFELYLAKTATNYKEMAENNMNLIIQKNAQINQISQSYLNDTRDMQIDNLNAISDIEKCHDMNMNLSSQLIGELTEKECCEDNLKLMPFINITNQWSANLTYDTFNFNCMDFSNGAVDIIRSLGYDAYVKAVKVKCTEGTYGCTNGRAGHAIVMVEVPFEAVEGFSPISPNDFNTYGLDR
jgi:hypothetical protein